MQGTGFVYNTLLQPYVSRYETDIDRGLLELKQRAWDLVSDYWRYSSEMGSKKAAQLFHLMLSQSARVAAPVPPADQHAENESNVAPPPPPPPTPPSTPSGPLKRTKSDKRPPIPTSGPSTPRRDGTPKHSSFKVQLHKQTQFIHSTPDTDVGNGSEETSDGEHDLHTPNPGQGRRSTHFKSN
ncbi:UNVERIFIED_CONTAM: hypothetical protein Sradi_4314300 [Sesamum radiatum]|uniref:Uncharacterized protein n=1 Tax=Sesamum radiatum TaxID=300843 RepID=A0AAW2NPK3_SESRA